jgi:hypothetical protein
MVVVATKRCYLAAGSRMHRLLWDVVAPQRVLDITSQRQLLLLADVLLLCCHPRQCWDHYCPGNQCRIGRNPGDKCFSYTDLPPEQQVRLVAEGVAWLEGIDGQSLGVLLLSLSS